MLIILYLSIDKIYAKFGSEQISFAKAQLYGLVLANATFYLSNFKLLVFLFLLGYFLHLLLSTLLQVVSAISNNIFT